MSRTDLSLKLCYCVQADTPLYYGFTWFISKYCAPVQENMIPSLSCWSSEGSRMRACDPFLLRAAMLVTDQCEWTVIFHPKADAYLLDYAINAGSKTLVVTFGDPDYAREIADMGATVVLDIAIGSQIKNNSSGDIREYSPVLEAVLLEDYIPETPVMSFGYEPLITQDYCRRVVVGKGDA